jgi:tetratricopeptide (TPR) repeat protein
MIINAVGEDLGVSSPIPSKKEEDTTAKMLEHLRRTVRLDPSRERAWDLLTVILLDKKETDEALTVARRRIEFKDNAHNRFLLAKVYAASNQFDKAAEELRAGLKNNSKDLNCHLGLIALVLKRDDERALQDARKRFAVIAPRMKEEKNKQCWLSYFLLRGIHYGLCDRPDWAREWFKQVLRRINGETTATRALAALGEPLGLAEQQLAIDYIEERRGRVARADAQIASPVERVSLCGDQITDEDLFVLTAFPDLHELNLSMTAITDAGLAHLKTLHHLHELDLSNTTITDVGLAQLTELKDLRRLLLGSTRITPRGIAELRKALPKLEVSR